MRGLRSRVPALGLVVVTVVLSSLPVAGPAAAQSVQCGPPAATSRAAGTSEEARMVSLVNGFRKERGLGTLSVHTGLVAKARDWAHVMAREGRIRHSDLTRGVTGGAVAAAENVGCDRAVDEQHEAFVRSPVHRRNLLERGFTHVGVGMAYAPDGELYTSQVFMTVEGSAEPDPPPAAAPASVAPTRPPPPGPPPALRADRPPAAPGGPTAPHAASRPAPPVLDEALPRPPTEGGRIELAPLWPERLLAAVRQMVEELLTSLSSLRAGIHT